MIEKTTQELLAIKQDCDERASKEFKAQFGEMVYKILNQQEIIRALSERMGELEAHIKVLEGTVEDELPQDAPPETSPAE